MTWTLLKDKEIIIQLSDDFVDRLVQTLNELKNQKKKDVNSAHNKADEILLEFVPDQIKEAWTKVVK
jgi:vacuolar-type H+-ATPase subunit H